MTRNSLVAFILGLMALSTIPSYAGPPKKRRDPRRKPSAAGTPELTLTSLRRLDRGPVFPGNPITVRATVKNRSRRTARMGVLLTPTHPAAQPIRSAPKIVRGHGTAHVDMKIVVDRYGVKDERFNGLFMLFDPTSSPRPYLGQRWKDGNQGDNQKRLAVAVNVPNYSVKVSIRKLTIHSTCGGYRWSAEFGVGSLPHVYQPRRPGDFPKLRSGFRLVERGHWGEVLGSRTRFSVGETIDIPRLSKSHHLSLTWLQKSYADPAQNEEMARVGQLIELIEPARWRRGGTFHLRGVLGPNVGKCEGKQRPYELEVEVRAYPANEALH